MMMMTMTMSPVRSNLITECDQRTPSGLDQHRKTPRRVFNSALDYNNHTFSLTLIHADDDDEDDDYDDDHLQDQQRKTSRRVFNALDYHNHTFSLIFTIIRLYMQS